MQSLKRIWGDIRHGENIDLYVAVPLALIIALLGVFGITSPELLASITLIILSLLATSLLANRYALKELSKKLSETSETFFFKNLSETEFEEDFESATDLWLVGVSLTTIVRIHYSLIEKKLQAGHSVKALLVHPEGVAIEISETRAYGRADIERAKGEIRNTLQYLCDLRHSTNGKLEIRTIQNPLGHGLVAKDPETASGILYIQNYPFKTEGGSRPKFILRAKDGYWYDFFKKELHNLWEYGIEWECS